MTHKPLLTCKDTPTAKLLMILNQFETFYIYKVHEYINFNWEVWKE